MVLDVLITSLGPIALKGHARCVVTLYNGYEVDPGPTGRGHAAATALKHAGVADAAGALFQWREVLSLEDVQITATSTVVLEVYSRKPGASAGAAADEQMVAWAWTNVLDPTGSVREGVLTAPAYRPPLALQSQSKSKFGAAAIAVSFDLRYASDAIELDGATAAEDDGDDEDPDFDIPTAAWIKAARPPLIEPPFAPGDGFVLYVDAARFLPENVSLSRAVGALYTSELHQLGESFEAAVLPSSDALNPVYAYRRGFDASEWLDPTTVVLLQIEAVDRDELELRVVGYAMLNLFVDSPQSLRPAPVGMDTGYYLNAGSFQLRLHTKGPVPKAGVISLEDMDAQPRLPCASVLVRLEALGPHGPGPVTLPPPYAAGGYDSMRCRPNALEAKLFPLRLLRAPLPVSDVATELAEATDGPGATPPSAPDALAAWMRQWLRRPELSNDEPLNYWMGAEYVPSLGFSVAVDAAARLQKSLPCAAVHSLAPPGSFYAENPLVADVKLSAGFDLTSALRSPRWTTGYSGYASVAHHRRAVVVIDVRGLLKSGSTVPMGWAVLPLFDKRGPYVLSGAYQLPLFAGVPSQRILDEITDEHPEDAIARALKQERLRFTSSRASVYVRLLDSQWGGQLREPLHSVRAQAGAVMPWYVHARDRAEFRAPLASKTYVDGAMPKAALFANAMTPEGWAEAMAIAFLRSLGLPGADGFEVEAAPGAGAGLVAEDG